MDIRLWIWVFTAAIITAIYVILIKYYVKTKNHLLILLIILTLIISTYAYYRVFSSKDIGVGYTLIKALSIIMVTLSGIVLFHEHVDAKGYLALFLIIIGILLLAF